MVQRVLGILSWVGVVLVFGALVVRFTKPEWDQYATYGAYAGLALVLLYTFGQWREIVAFFQRRNARYGTIAAASVVVVLGILAAINYLSDRRNKRWDLTENKQYSLSEQTNKLVGSLTAPAKFMVFDQATALERFRPRLDAYKYGSSQVQVDYVDVDKDPVKTKEYKVDTYGTIVVEYMGRTERVTTDSEQDITNALIKVVNPTAKKVYFLSGHGEKDPANSDRKIGYSSIADALKRDNFEFTSLALAQTGEIPKDATVLVIAGPRTDLLEQEVPIINTYLTSRSGKLLVLFDPPEDLKQPSPMSRLAGLLDEWGIKSTDTVVLDVTGLTSNPTAPVAVPPYPAHAITNNFGFITAFPLVRALQAETSPQKRSGQTFLQTGARSWAEKSLASLTDQKNPVSADPAQGDIPGPVSIGVATAVPASTPEPTSAANTTKKSEDDPKKPETRVAAIGDSDFIANAYLGVEGNRDLFMNVVNWLAQQENLIAIRPREPADRRMTLTENKTTAILLLSIFVIPGVVLGAGVYSWWRRR
ncbi:MAG TPA: Gldg family protein [Vicinamibacterales bacterium]|nr:Gldg family protein [Vicinamibacterales bacterium]